MLQKSSELHLIRRFPEPGSARPDLGLSPFLRIFQRENASKEFVGHGAGQVISSPDTQDSAGV